MVIGCAVNLTVYQMLKKGETCDVTMENIKYSAIMYLSYLLLFAHFFWRAYMTGTSLMKCYKIDGNKMEDKQIEAKKSK
jgi:elongation of very long chain fatty acids protein 6